MEKNKALYDTLVKDGYEIGDYDSFKKNLSNKDNRKALYDAVSNDYNLGDYDSFEQKLGFNSSSPIPTQPEQPAHNFDAGPYQSPIDLGQDFINQAETFGKQAGKLQESTQHPIASNTLSDGVRIDEKENDSYIKDMGEKFGAGTLRTIGGAYSLLNKFANIPDYVEKQAGEKYGRFGKAFSDQFLPLRVMRNAYKEMADTDMFSYLDGKAIKESARRLSAKGDRYGSNQDGSKKTFVDLWKEGDYSGAAGDIFLQATESLPQSLAIIGATISGGGTPALAMAGAISADDKYDQLAEDKPDMNESLKMSNAILTGAMEALTERLGDVPVAKWLGKTYGIGSETGKEAIKKGLFGWVDNMMKKYGIALAPIEEGTEEFVNQIAGNIIDKATGVNPAGDITDGALEAFVYGAGGGMQFSAIGAPKMAYDKIRKYAGKTAYADAESKRVLRRSYENAKANLSNEEIALIESNENIIQSFSEPDQKRFEEYIEAREAYLGLIEGVQDKINNQINEAIEHTKEQINPDMDALVAVELTNGNKVQVVGGTVTSLDDGSIDKSNSTPIVIIDNGVRKVVPAKEIQSLISSIPATEAIEATRKEIEENASLLEASEIEEAPLNLQIADEIQGQDGIYTVTGMTPEGLYIMQTPDGKFIDADDNAIRSLSATIKDNTNIGAPIVENEIEGAPVSEDNTNIASKVVSEGDTEGSPEMGLTEGSPAFDIKSLPAKKDGSLDFAKFTPLQRFQYTESVDGTDVAIEDLTTDIEATQVEIEAIKGKIVKAKGSERIALRENLKAKEAELSELASLLPDNMPQKEAQNDSETGAGNDVLPHNNTPTESSEAPQIPVDKEGNVDYNAITGVDMYAEALRSEFEEEDAMEIVSNNLTSLDAEAKGLAKIKDVVVRKRAEKKIKEKIQFFEDVRVKLQTKEIAPVTAEQKQAEKAVIESEIADNRTQFPNITERWEKSSKHIGNKDEIILPNGEKIAGSYVLTSAFALTPSHNPFNNFAKSEGFPVTDNGKTINDRDYEADKNAQLQVEQRAGIYDQRALQTPVIVSKDGVVISGNDRTMSGQLAAQRGTDNAYNDYLLNNAGKYGFTPEQVSIISSPRVVFVPDVTPSYSTETFAKFNKEDKKTQNKTEKAVAHSKTLKPETIGKLARIMDDYDTLDKMYDNPRAVKEIVSALQRDGVIGTNEIADMIDGDILSGSGRDFIENLVIGGILGEKAIRQLNGMRDVRQTIVKSATHLVANKKLGDYSLSDEINDAIDLVYNARKQGMRPGETVDMFMRTQSMFDESPIDLYGETVQMLANTINKGQSFFKKVVTSYNERGLNASTGQSDIFTGEVEDKDQIIKDALKLFGYEQGTRTAKAERAGTEETGNSEKETGDAETSDEGSGTEINVESYIQSMPKMQASRMSNILNKPVLVEGKPTTRAKFIEDAVSEGREFVININRGKIEYGIKTNEGYLSVNKSEYDYAAYLGGNMPTVEDIENEQDKSRRNELSAKWDYPSIEKIDEKIAWFQRSLRVINANSSEGKKALSKLRELEELKALKQKNTEQEEVDKGEIIADITQDEANVDINPTQAQKEAGNYRMGHVEIDGHNITIENPKGSVRSGVDASGKEWSVEMKYTYGYIKGTKGKDGDHIDIFLSDNPTNGNVFVVDQVNKDGSFDEHKVMYGFESIDDAREAYMSNYEKGWTGLGNITEVSKENFGNWLASGTRKMKPFAEYKSVKSESRELPEKVTLTKGDFQTYAKGYYKNGGDTTSYDLFIRAIKGENGPHIGKGVIDFANHLVAKNQNKMNDQAFLNLINKMKRFGEYEIAKSKHDYETDTNNNNNNNIFNDRKGKYKTTKGEQLEFTFSEELPRQTETDSVETGRSDLQREENPLLGTYYLGRLKDGEICHVERVFVESKAFDFTGSQKIETAEDVAYIFKNLEDESVENTFAVLAKDGIPTILHVGMGGYTESYLNGTAIKAAYDRIGADKIYFIHNHPSGNLKPSEADKQCYSSLRALFGDILQPGIIINLKSGKFAQFTNHEESTYDNRTPANEIPLKLYSFSKQVFNKDYDPMSLPSIQSSDDIASFISSHRLGDRDKMSVLILSHSLKIIGNVFLDQTSVNNSNSEEIAKKLISLTTSLGGTRCVLYGRCAYDVNTGSVSSKVRRMSRNQIDLLDVINISDDRHKSASDSASLSEDATSYNYSKTDTQIKEEHTQAAHELASELGIEIEILSKEYLPEGHKRAQGYFNPRTGKIAVCPENHASIEDVRRTIFHEAVAHKGLRGLFGKEFDNFLDKTYHNASEDVRRRVNTMASRNGWNVRVATEEYLANQAETGFDDNLFSTVKQLFNGMISKAKKALGFKLSDADIKYVLWKSYRNLKGKGSSVFDVAEDVAMKYRLFRESSDNSLSKQIKNFIEELERTSKIEYLPYANYGVRFDKRNLAEGEEVGNSKSNIGRLDARNFPEYGTEEYEDLEELNGSSAYYIFDGIKESPYRFIENLLHDFDKNNDNKDVDFYIIGTNDEVEYGEDEHEVIMPNAVVVKKLDNNNFGIKENLSDPFNDDFRFRERTDAPPVKTGIGYKVFVLKNNKLYPPMVANPNGADTPVNVWLDADAAPVAGESKTGRPQVKAGGKGTQGGSGKLAYRPGWHLGVIPYAIQFNRLNETTGEKELFPANFVWAEVEYANDVDYNDEAYQYGVNKNGKYQHSLAGLPRLPKDGSYMYRTNPNPETDPWVITGAIKVNRILKPSEVDEMVIKAGREPQLRQSGAITDEQIDKINEKLVSDDVLFREPDDSDDNIPTSEDLYPNAGEKWAYEQILQSNKFKLAEAYVDRMKSLKVLQETIAKGKEIPSSENAYMYENTVSSRSTIESEIFADECFKPMVAEIAKLEKDGLKYDAIKEYVIARSGIERNVVFAWRDAMENLKSDFKKEDIEYLNERYEVVKSENDSKLASKEINIEEWVENMDDKLSYLLPTYDKYRKRDYSGLSSLANENKEYEKMIISLVSDIESKYNTNGLWNKVNNATKSTLKKSFDSGVMSKNLFKKLSNMFQYYVPLRGFDETTAEDVYQYIQSTNNSFNPTVKKAGGRTSIADDPFANIGSMGESAILQGNKNIMKQHLYRLAANHPSKLLTIGEAWVVKNGNDWSFRFPEIDEDTKPSIIEDIIEEFKAEMEDLKSRGDAMTHKEALKLGLRIMKYDIQEHIVVAKINGNEHFIIVNGDPRVAQAVNGLLNDNVIPNEGWGKIINGIRWANRQLAANFTTRNPEFVVSNLIRDMIFSNTAIAVKESPAYMAKFVSNIPKSMAMVAYGLKDRNNDPMFREFLENGGETGYTQLNNTDAYKRILKKEIRKLNGGIDPIKGFRVAAEWFSNANRWAEDISRFNTYMTSREMGRTITRSISDAKEITVNFNRQGAGGYGQNVFKSLYLFFNAAVQSLNNAFGMAKSNPVKFSAAMTTFAAAGFIVPILNRALIEAAGGDDKETYNNLPEWVRKNNLCLWMGGDKFLTIPLPIELRALYGIGDIAHQMMIGNMKHKNVAAEVAKQIIALSPLDPFADGGGVAGALTPDAAKPFVQAYVTNTDYFGLPVYRENDYNERMPEYTKAYKSVNPFMVGASEWLNEVSGGDKYTRGKVNVNPARVEHVLENIFGGMAKTISKAGKAAFAGINGDNVPMRQIPMASRFVAETDERGQFSQINERFQYYMDRVADIKQRDSGYAKEFFGLEKDKYTAKYKDLVRSDDYKIMQAFKVYDRIIQQIRKKEKEIEQHGGSQDLKKEVQSLKTKFIEYIDEQ